MKTITQGAEEMRMQHNANKQQVIIFFFLTNHEAKHGSSHFDRVLVNLETIVTGRHAQTLCSSQEVK